jgi:uncharacterized protein
MLETLKAMILDFQEATPETGVARHLRLKPVKGKAAVCIGVRRSGKSTYLAQIIKRLRDAGVDRTRILYLNFFDDRIHGMTASGPGLVTEAYFILYPEKKNAETVYCFFDEIQVVPGWEAFVDRLMRTERCEAYLTGSSAQMLSKEIATRMRGRALAWELFPFSFREFLDWKGIAATGALSTKQRLLVQKAFGEYRATGGFPEVAGLDRSIRVRVLQEYFHAILARDLVERHDPAHPRAVTDLAHRLIDNTASLYSINRLTGFLKSLGHKVPKAAVSDYLTWFEDAYFFFSVRLFDASLTRSQANPKKIYCVDHAMVDAVSSGILVNTGHLLENLVFMGLRRLHPEIFYYRTRTGREVDFAVPGRGRKVGLVQVCDSLADPATRRRELTALGEAMAEQGVATSTLVTMDEQDEVVTVTGTITVVPVWRFLFELPEAVE